MNGIEIITKEREQQPTRGYDKAHDLEHDRGEIVFGALAYAVESVRPGKGLTYWMWDEETWKPGDKIKNLAKAGAMIAAEIDRELSLRTSDKAKVGE